VTVYGACIVERRVLVTHLGPGPRDTFWVTGHCGIPLFSKDKLRTAGVCSTCAKGWTHQYSYATAKGRQLIRFASWVLGRAAVLGGTR
jgi:hypothetical protein